MGPVLLSGVCTHPRFAVPSLAGSLKYAYIGGL